MRAGGGYLRTRNSHVDHAAVGHSPECVLAAWLPLLMLPPCILLFAPAAWPRWALMWTVSVAIFAGCKWLTWWSAPPSGAGIGRQLGYLFGWPGLDARGFFQPNEAARRPSFRGWLGAAGKLLFGLVVLYGFARLVPADQSYFAGWIGMIGLVLVLHFGLFHLLSCAWRTAGVDARPLMHWPICSTSLSGFWGERWNRAFRDLTHRFLFRPLTPLLGARGALFAGFVFSGLVHDVVISLPAGGGYGGPTLFFLLQAAGLLVERSKTGRKLGLGSGPRGWLFTMAVLLAPAGLLFHPPFVTRVVYPFLQAIGAL